MWCRLCIAFVFLMGLNGCTAQRVVGTPNAALNGYSSMCSGTLKIDTGESPVLRLIVPGGMQRIVIEHESEPEPPEVYPGPSEYRCAAYTRHEVTFEAAPGKEYRFYAEREGTSEYKIIAYEILDAPHGRAVATGSRQLSANRACRFYSPEICS